MHDATLADLIAELDVGHLIPGDSPLHQAMHRQSQEAIRITTELNERDLPRRGGRPRPAQ